MMGKDTNGDGIGEPVLRYVKPNVGQEYPIAVPQTSDDFNTQQLGLQWQWQANQLPEWYSLTDDPGNLRLNCVTLPEGIVTLYDAPQLLMQKLPAPTFSATTKLVFHPEQEGDTAGLIIFGFSYRYLALNRSSSGSFQLVLVQGEGRGGTSIERVEAVVDYSSEVVYIKVIVSGDAECSFSFSSDGEHYTMIGQPFQATEGRWVGAKIGIFTVNREAVASNGYTNFNGFTVDPV